MADLEIVNVSFDQLVAGQVGDSDVALSQMTITDERKQVVDFTEPYFASDQGVLVTAGTEVATVEDARALQWGVQSGTTGADYIAETLQPEHEAQVFQDLSAGFAALEAGQLDACMMDTAIVLAQASESGGAQEVVAQFKTGSVLGIVTESVVTDGKPEELGYLSVTTVEPIYICLADHLLLPSAQSEPWDGLWNSRGVDLVTPHPRGVDQFSFPDDVEMLEIGARVEVFYDGKNAYVEVDC